MIWTYGNITSQNDFCTHIRKNGQSEHSYHYIYIYIECSGWKILEYDSKLT
jgi:hypothetical protein